MEFLSLLASRLSVTILYYIHYVICCHSRSLSLSTTRNQEHGARSKRKCTSNSTDVDLSPIGISMGQSANSFPTNASVDYFWSGKFIGIVRTFCLIFARLHRLLSSRPRHCTDTAIVYMHRFYMFRDTDRFLPQVGRQTGKASIFNSRFFL